MALKKRDKEWQNSNLAFLGDFLDRIQVTALQLAEKLEITKQSVHYWFAKDDCKVSVAHRIVNACGYDIRFTLQKSSELTEKIPAPIKGNDEPRLQFLWDYLDAHPEYEDRILKELDMANSTFYYWSRADDCFVGYLIRIAKCTGAKLRISIMPK